MRVRESQALPSRIIWKEKRRENANEKIIDQKKAVATDKKTNG